VNIYEVHYDDYTWHVVAETRNKAKTAFINYSYDEIEWIYPLGIRILAKNVDMPTGVDDNYIWARKNHVSLYFWEFTDEMKDSVCQECAHLLWETEEGVAFCPDCVTKPAVGQMEAVA
jgi:hypothetical protein